MTGVRIAAFLMLSLLSGAAMATPQYVFVGEDNAVNEYTTSGTLVRSIAVPSFGWVNAITFDSTGTMWVANGSVVEAIKPSTGATRTISTGLGGAWAIAFDASGDLYATGGAANTTSVYEIANAASGGSTVTRTLSGSQFNYAYGVGFDAAGDMFVSNGVGGTIVKYSAASLAGASPAVTSTITVPGDGNLDELALDSSGNLYVADYGGGYSHQIYKVIGAGSGGTTVSTLSSASEIYVPNAVAVDSSGSVYVSNNGAYSGGYSPTGGYVSLISNPTTTPGYSTLVGSLYAPEGIAIGADFSIPEPASALIAAPFLLAAHRFRRRS